MRLHSSTRGAVAAALLGCSLASAQSTEQLPGFDLERLDTNVGRGTLLVGNGELMVPGGMSVSLLGHYQRLPLTLSDGVQDLQVVSDRATALLAASYGVLDWLELSAQVPFVLWQQGDDPTQAGLAPLTAQGIGTPVIQARLGLLSRNRQKPVDLSADVGVGLPFGTGPALAGDAGPRFHARLSVGTTLGWLQPSLEAGVLFRPTVQLASSEEEVKPGASSEVRLGAALATTGKGLRGELGLRATLAPQVSMELLGGVRFPLLAGLDGFVQGGPGLGGALGTPRFRMLVGVTFRDEPPPSLVYIGTTQEPIQVILDEPEPPPVDNQVRPVSTHDLYISRGDPRGSSAEEGQQEPLRPYQPTPDERLILRGEIYFSRGSSELPGVVPLLDQAVRRLLEQPTGTTMIVEGHADTENTDVSNRVMSLERAQEVRRYVVAQGIPWRRVQIRSFGSDWPVSPRPATDQERQLNRRAEVLVLYKLPVPAATPAPITTETTVP